MNRSRSRSTVRGCIGSWQPIQQRGRKHGSAARRHRAGFRGSHNARTDPLPRLDRRLKPEFDRRNVKIIGLSVDSTADHDGVDPGHRGRAGASPQLSDHRRRRLQRLEAVRDAPRRHDRRTAKAHPGRQPDRPQRLRDRPDKKIKLILVYPMTTGRNFDEGSA